MMHLLLSALAMTMTVLGFTRLYSFDGINACYLSLYKGLIEECVVVADSKGAYLGSPLIYSPKLSAMLKEHFQVNLAPYCRDYTYSCESLDLIVSRQGKEYWKSAKITFSATVDDLLTIDKTAVFTIERTSI